jgi:hypothetical protein
MGSSVDDLTCRTQSDVRTSSGIRGWPVARVRRETLLLRASAELYSSVSPLNHGHETSWRRELFFLISRLSRFDLLDRGGLVALLCDVRWWVRWWWWSVVGYRPRHWLLGTHPLLKCSVETKEFSTLDEEVCRSSYSILVKICMPWASAIKHLLCRQLWLSSAPLLAWLQVTAGSSAAAAMVTVSSSR